MISTERVLRNLKVKLFAVACALFLWFFVVTGNEYYQSIQVPLVLTHVPDNYVLVDPIPREAEVLLRGAGRDLINVASRDKHIELDLAGHRIDHQFRLTLPMLRGLPADMNVTPVQIVGPDSVTVQLDRFMRKKVPVTSRVHVAVMPGYTQVGDVTCAPDSVWIEGPRARVDTIKSVSTVELAPQDLFKDMHHAVPLQLVPEPTVAFSREEVTFSVDIQRIGERVLSGIPLRVINIPGHVKDVRVLPSTLTLTLHAGVDVLAALDKSLITATIDFKKWRSDTPVSAFFTLPESIFYYDAKPKSFELLIE